MNPWHALGINSSADKKSIKRAYAGLLKNNKPDENPQGFEELHSAYKYCLDNISFDNQNIMAPTQQNDTVIINNNSSTNSTSESETDKKVKIVQKPFIVDDQITSVAEIEEHEIETIPASIPLETAPEHIENQQETIHLDYLRDQWRVLEEQTNQAFEKITQVNKTSDWEWNHAKQKISDWAFVEKSDVLYDIEFKDDFSNYLFERWLHFFEKNSETINRYRNTLRYLNQIFHWTDNNKRLEYLYSLERIDVFLMILSDAETAPQTIGLKWTSPKVHIGPIHNANCFARIIASFIDILIIVFVCIPWFKETTDAVLSILTLYALSMPILEASPLQGSLGKVLLGFKVTNTKGMRLNILHAIARQVLFLLSIAGISLTIWAIMYTLGEGRFLHDTFSKTLVIKR